MNFRQLFVVATWGLVSSKKITNQVAPSVSDTDFTLITPSILKRYEASVVVKSSRRLPETETYDVRMDDITFISKGNNVWEVINKTPLSVKEIPIAVIGEKGSIEIAVLNLNDDIPLFTSARITIKTVSSSSKLSYYNQMRLMTPTWRMQIEAFGATPDECDNKVGKKCFSFLKTREERDRVETVVSNMYKAANTMWYQKEIQAYYTDKSTALKNMLQYGMNGHLIRLKGQRGKPNLGGGVGGGSTPSILKPRSDKEGWASQASGNLNNLKGWDYFTKFYQVWIHEIAHGFGFSHKSQMAGKFGKIFAKALIDNVGEGRRERGTHGVPAVLQSFEMINEDTLRVFFFHAQESNNVSVKLITTSAWNYTIKKNNGGFVDIKFRQIPSSPVWIRAGTTDDEYMSTLLLRKEDFVKNRISPTLTPTMLLPAASPTTFPGCVRKNTNIVCADKSILTARSLEECSALCVSGKGCAAWVWHSFHSFPAGTYYYQRCNLCMQQKGSVRYYATSVSVTAGSNSCRSGSNRQLSSLQSPSETEGSSKSPRGNFRGKRM